MKCDDVVDRLPDESPDIVEHLRGCAACRTLQEAYDRDADRLAAGLRAAAGDPKLGAASLTAPRTAPPRRIVPLAAAAGMLVGVLAILFVPQRGVDPVRPPANPAAKPALLVIHGDGEGDLQIIPTDHVLWAQVAGLDENKLVSITAGTADALAGGELLTVYRRIQGGYREVGTLRLLEVGESISKGRMADVKDSPRLCDLVVAGRPLEPRERDELLEYVFSFRLHGGNPASPYDRLVRDAGLEHDVEFLARLKDPRAYDRLARILGGLKPFLTDGFPAPTPDLAARMHDWWAGAKDRVQWNVAADRFEE